MGFVESYEFHYFPNQRPNTFEHLAHTHVLCEQYEKVHVISNNLSVHIGLLMTIVTIQASTSTMMNVKGNRNNHD